MSGTEAVSEFDLDLALEALSLRGDVLEMTGLIKHLGEQIAATKESIQKDWQAFSEESQLSLEADPSSIKDFSQYFQGKIELENHSCTTEPINLNVFLNNVVQALERNVGQEEKILEELTNFAADQGFVLPAAYPETSEADLRRSTASLNVVFSENEETTSTLWERIGKMVSKGLLSTIDKLGLTEDKSKAEVLLAKKVKLLEKMCMLYTPSDVWRKYLALRNQQIERFLQNSANLDGFEIGYRSTDEDTSGGTACLVRVSRVLDVMLREDYNIVELGMFPDAFQMQPEEIFSVYLSGFKNELQEVVKTLHALGRRGSTKVADNSGSTLSLKIFLALKQCVLAASSADLSAKKFLRSLQFSYDEKQTQVDTNFGSTFSLSSSGPIESTSTTEVEVSVEEVVRDQPEQSQKDIWYWQDEFKPVISKLALAIAENIQLVTRTTLETELENYEKNRQYEATNVDDKLLNGSLDYPKQIAKSCSLIIGQTDELLSFLLLRPGKEFEAVRNSFIESLTTVLMAYQSRLVRMSSDVPRNAPIGNLYLAFNSAIFIQHTLKRYEDDYGEMTGSVSTVYCDLIEDLNEKIMSYHYATIATVILQDVQSHHWMNHKEFFEGERCSFSVQMWNYYMQGLQHDLWEMCAPVKAQAIFTSVLQYSLSCLVRRYSKAIPTYRRTKLFRSDITALLFSVSSSMIFNVSTSSTDIFNPDPTKNAITEIHNSCSALLAIMTVISCPLETLCLFTSGGAEELINDGKATNTSWLSWLQPELFGEHSKSLLSLSDIQAVNIYFKLMISQPQPIWKLVLQTVLLRNAYIAVTIVTYLESHQIHVHTEEVSRVRRKSRVQFQSQCLVATDGTDQENCSSIVGSLYYVTLKCCKRSKPMVNYILALINRGNSWQLFTSAEGLRLGDEDKIPAWLDCVYLTFKPFICRLRDLAISRFSDPQEQPALKSFKFTCVNSLPCGCQTNKPSPAGRHKDETLLLFEAFERVLKTLASSLRLLPRIMFKVFNRIEDDLRQLKLSSDDTSSAGLKILGSMLFRCFSSTGVDDIPEESCSQDEIVNECTKLAQLLYHVMAGEMEGFYEKAGLPTALETLMTNKKDWIIDHIRRISDIISEMDDEESFTESGQDNFLELQFGLRVQELFLDNKGEKALKQVYNFFKAKKDWILRRIPLVSHLGSLQQTQAKRHDDAAMFNPQQAYSWLGEYPFDHEAIECFPFDWEQMFQSNIGMSLKSFKRLVYNRYELQNEKDVEEDKKEFVEKLKAFYDQDSDTV